MKQKVTHRKRTFNWHDGNWCLFTLCGLKGQIYHHNIHYTSTDEKVTCLKCKKILTKILSE